MSRFAMTYCSQCGQELGSGDEGVSHCSDHRSVMVDAELLYPSELHEGLFVSQTGGYYRLASGAALPDSKAWPADFHLPG